ncbi:hypothetical protein Pmani_006887 [Petrolisthes manimaculis]|uniref:Uncharacterized protein n=1 Tax=Petrolisthes manimaculis TaxID=1843537 RepID=A0AAE1Q9G8_9EUCA|nr:hypothetical protein Pmani_006887 [Petrolisthes manimaculis]
MASLTSRQPSLYYMVLVCLDVVLQTDEVQLSRTGSGWEFITGIRRILLWATEVSRNILQPIKKSYELWLLSFFGCPVHFDFNHDGLARGDGHFAQEEGDRKGKVYKKEISKIEIAQNSVKSKVKIKAFEPPMFNGNVRDYPRFKEDFKNLVKSVYGEDAYALKKCLSGDALQTVKGVEGNNIEMMQRLDDKYGNMRKVMDLVISDLKALKKINEGDTKGFVKLVDQVEQCWLDLKNINLEEELNMANIVSHIERVLPNLQKREWIIKAEEVLAAKDLFPTLLKFLQRERRILEYMNSSVRTAGSDKISVHHVSNTSDIVMESEVITLIKQMNEEQQQKNKELESCIVNLTEMVKGSDITLVTHHVAEKLRLKGKDINLSMIKVGNVLENYSSKEYCIPLVDRSSQIWEIKAVGIDEISAKISKKIDVTRVPELFVGVSNHEIDRPSGEINMLIGVNYSELLPRVVQTNEGLLLLENPFGLSIRGKHNSISNSDNTDNNITVRTHKVSTAMNLNEIKIEPVDKLKNELDKFFALEESGVHCDPRCIKCLCKGCPVSDYVNIKEERELELIEEGLAYDEDGKCWIARYPWIKDPRYLKYNVKVAVARLKTTETRLRKLDVEYAQRYHKEIKDLVKRGVARKLSEEEIKTYNGPIHYIHHHEVLKPESSSTPLCIVFNSSASYVGQKLNDFWAKGPVILNNMLVVLLRFRQEKIAVTGDISKMYHSVKLCNIDQHTHRFLWMDLDVNRPPDHYVLTSVTFGDRPSGTIAMLALRHTVEKFGKGDPEVYDMIVNNTVPEDESRLNCTRTHQKGSYKREGNIEFNPYTTEEQLLMVQAVKRVNQTVQLLGYQPLPHYSIIM